MLTLVTLGVRDLERARRFYVEGLRGRVVLAQDDVVFVQAGHGLLLSLWGVDDLRADTGAEAFAAPADAPLALAHNVSSEEEVHRVLARAEAAGGTVLRAAERASWGGLQAYLADPDGFRWEVAHNPGLRVHADGRVELGGVEAAVTVRAATPRDAVAVAALHAQGIASGVASFEPEAPTAAEVLHRIVGTTGPHAWLVAELEGRVVGWAATAPYSVAGVLLGHRRGRGLREPRCTGAASAAGSSSTCSTVRRPAACTSCWPACCRATRRRLALFASAGFREAGLLRRHAQVGGEWRDCLLFEALLGVRPRRRRAARRPRRSPARACRGPSSRRPRPAAGGRTRARRASARRPTRCPAWG